VLLKVLAFDIELVWEIWVFMWVERDCIFFIGLVGLSLMVVFLLERGGFVVHSHGVVIVRVRGLWFFELHLVQFVLILFDGDGEGLLQGGGDVYLEVLVVL
jgi:inner membrane protein involved in colicin E2 resistance